MFLLENAEFTKRLLRLEYTGVVKNSSSTKLSYSKLKNALLNPSKSFLALKKVSPRILSTFKRSFSKKMGKTPSSHIIHSLGGWIVQDIEPIRLLKSPRSLSVYIPIWHITLSRDKNANTVLSEMTITLIITTLGNIIFYIEQVNSMLFTKAPSLNQMEEFASFYRDLWHAG